jgi:two-component system, cell cycle response regulator
MIEKKEGVMNIETLNQNSERISSITGEFNDSLLEKEFFSYMIEETVQHFRRNLLVFSFIFLLFIIPDYFLIQDLTRLTVIFLIRVLFLLLSILYFIRIQYMPRFLYVFSTVYELIGTVLSWGLLLFYEHPDVVIHQQGLIVIILAIFFIIPNRFYIKVLMSLLITAGFFYIALLRELFSFSSYSWGLLVFSILIIIFCSFTTRRLNRLQRMQFQTTQELRRISTIDSLTDIYNRMKYDEELEKEISRAQRYQLPLSGIMFDLDNFKKINDRYGHLEGDKVLKKVSLLVRTIIRENDLFFRWGGEEFIILLPNTDLDSATQLAYRVQDCIRNADFTTVKGLTCSFGVTALKKGDTADNFTERLDQLQYEAKREGKDRIVPDLPDKNLRLFELGEE